MTPVMTAAPKTASAFPVEDIEACIREYVAEGGATQAVLRGDGAQSAGYGANIGPQLVIDSLVIAVSLVEVEAKVPFVLPDNLVQAGGYDSVDKVVQHLMPQLQKRWRKHHEEKK